MCIGLGATDNAGNLILARGVMVPLFSKEVWRGETHSLLLERQLVVLQCKLVPPVSGSKKKKTKKREEARYVKKKKKKQ